ncbi:MAG: hypothetical protein U1F11_03545 [Steroidobacteraceae bacterium]
MLQLDAAELDERLALAGFDAAPAMSHYLVADGRYPRRSPRARSTTSAAGPAARRERLMANGASGRTTAGTAAAPVGLDLGADSEAIALSIVAEIQAARARAAACLEQDRG